MTIHSVIGEEMKKMRIISGETQKEIAKKLKITTEHYGRLERGERKISLDFLIGFAEKHNFEPARFLEKSAHSDKKDVVDEINKKLMKYSFDWASKVLEMMKLFEK